MQDSSEHKLYIPSLTFNRTKGKCPNKCWIGFSSNTVLGDDMLSM